MPTAEFAHVQAGCLPSGTVTSLGTITRTSDTGYEIDDEHWISFRVLHGRPAPVMPLVTLTGTW